MKKKQAVFTIVACSIAALLLIGVLAVGLSSDGFGIAELRRAGSEEARGDGSFAYEYTWDPSESEVHGLDVEWINGTVDVRVGSGSLIRIKETSAKALKEDEKLRLSSSGNVLKIKWEDRIINFSLFQNRYKNLTIEVPKEVAEALEEFHCSNTSGKIAAAGFTAEEMEVSTASGSVELSRLNGEELEISTASGSISLEDAEFTGKLSVNTASGSVELSGIKAEEASLNTVSGRVRYAGTAKKVNANSVSASVRLDLDVCPEEADLDSVSGGLTLVLPENAGFQAEYDSVSGKFSSGFPVTDKAGLAVYGSGKAKFSFSTTSGDMKVEKKP